MKKIRYPILVILQLFFSSVVWGACPNKFFDESCSCKPPANGYCITAGDKRFTNFKIAEDLKNIVAADAGLELKVMEGGSVKNIKRMRWQHGVKLSIIQSDILQFYDAEQKKGNPVAAEIIKPLRAVFPLYDEEVHILVKATSTIETFSDLKDKKLALGRLTSGASVTVNSIYQLMFNEEIPTQNLYFTPETADSIDDGLSALANDKVDAWAVVVSQGTERIADFLPEAAQHFKFVKFDVSNPQEKKALEGTYSSATIRQGSYPWLDEDVPTLATKAMLITQKYTNRHTKNNIRKLTESLCKNFSRLQAEGDPKWRDAELVLMQLPLGWEYSEDVLRGFDSEACNIEQAPVAESSNTENEDASCLPQEAVLGLCMPNTTGTRR